MNNTEITPKSKSEFNVDTPSKPYQRGMERLGLKEKKNILKWRGFFSVAMCIFISVQYIVLIYLVISQGIGNALFFNSTPFNVDSRIFYWLIGGTLAQSYFLVQIIFQNVFKMQK